VRRSSGLIILALACAAPVFAKKAQVMIVPPKQRVCKAVTESGLGHRMLRAGKGPLHQGGQVLRVDYIGYLAKTGQVFDQGWDADFAPNDVVEGFGEGLKMMQTGGIYRLCIPPRLGYGNEAVGPIPARSDLVFQVSVRAIYTRAEHREWLRAQKEAAKANAR
jgi:FKBP-type peptidyl-prolyl cis-trans isomerase FkpA